MKTAFHSKIFFLFAKTTQKFCFCSFFESNRIWAAGLVVGEYCDNPSHWRNVQTLSQWLAKENIPGIQGIDTRQLTKKIREKGTILGKIVYTSAFPKPIVIKDPNLKNLVAEVSIKVNINLLISHYQHFFLISKNFTFYFG